MTLRLIEARMGPQQLEKEDKRRNKHKSRSWHCLSLQPIYGQQAASGGAEDLSKMIPDLGLKPIAFQLEVPDEVIRERAKKTGQESNRPEILEQRAKDYHREMDAISLYFPKAKVSSPSSTFGQL